MDQSWYSVLKSITEQKAEISVWGVPTFIPLGKSKEVISEEIRWYAEVMILK